MGRWRRLLLLLACLLAGALVAVVGHGLTGSSAWALGSGSEIRPTSLTSEFPWISRLKASKPPR